MLLLSSEEYTSTVLVVLYALEQYIEIEKKKAIVAA